jgi:hypothetical protein
MVRLSHRMIRLSIVLAGTFGALGAAGSGLADTETANGGTAKYYGRWSVSEDKPVFTARGRLYKTIDIAPCGRDFCGISVSEQGACGTTLFRFRTRGPDFDDTLHGHGVWGQARKNITLYGYVDPEITGGKSMEIALGDGYDFSERSDNMPKFRANYRPTGAARCTRRG